MVDLQIGGATRDEIARILEQVAKEGMDHSRDLDAAIDAIGSAFQCQPVTRINDGEDEPYWFNGHLTREEVDEQNGPQATFEHMYALECEHG